MVSVPGPCVLRLASTWLGPLRPPFGLVGFNGAYETIKLFFFGRAWMTIGELSSSLDQECEHPIGLVPTGTARQTQFEAP